MAWYPYQQRAAFNASTAVNNEFVRGSTYNLHLARGSASLDGSSGTQIATGLAGVVAAGVSLQTSAFTTDMPSHFTVQFTSATGNVDVYPLVATSSGSNALGLSTSTGTVNYWAIGY